MDDSVLAGRAHAGQKGFYRAVFGASPGGRVEQPAPGVMAVVTPATPDRSLPNAVIYDDPAAVPGVLPALADVYAGAGVRAWTVWVRPGHDELAASLEAAGHVRDGRPLLMGAALSELDLGTAEQDGLDLDPEPSWGTVGRLNDRAHDFEASQFEALVSGLSDPDSHLHVARADGEPAACVVTREEHSDAYVWFVATTPEARGNGLCSGLMRTALRAASERGCTTTTLEASPDGEPVYTRLGYRSLGRLGLWEHRDSAASA